MNKQRDLRLGRPQSPLRVGIQPVPSSEIEAVLINQPDQIPGSLPPNDVIRQGSTEDPEEADTGQAPVEDPVLPYMELGVNEDLIVGDTEALPQDDQEMTRNDPDIIPAFPEKKIRQVLKGKTEGGIQNYCVLFEEDNAKSGGIWLTENQLSKHQMDFVRKADFRGLRRAKKQFKDYE